MSVPSRVPTIPPPANDERPSGARIRGKTLSEFVGGRAEPKRRRGPPKTSDSKAAAARARVEEMAASGDWEGAEGIHLVALYEYMHAEVYGVEPLEVDAKARFLAVGAATRLVEKFFSGDYAAAVSYMRWVWQRESEREKWRRANGRDGGRIGWRLQFSPALVSDYRVHGERSR